jgi:hypothetical protein
MLNSRHRSPIIYGHTVDTVLGRFHVDKIAKKGILDGRSHVYLSEAFRSTLDHLKYVEPLSTYLYPVPYCTRLHAGCRVHPLLSGTGYILK